MEWTLPKFVVWKNATEEETDTENENNDTVDRTTLDDLKQALNEFKKACGLDGIVSELRKYGGLFFELQFLHLLNECWIRHDIRSGWHIGDVWMNR